MNDPILASAFNSDLRGMFLKDSMGQEVSLAEKPVQDDLDDRQCVELFGLDLLFGGRLYHAVEHAHCNHDNELLPLKHVVITLAFMFIQNSGVKAQS